MIGKSQTFSVRNPESVDPDILLHGFGACMISGVPHGLEDSFFWLTAEELSRRLRRTVHGRVSSYGGFPAHRAVAHVHRALADHPDFVVVQLGSTDLSVSLNYHVRSILSRGKTPLPSAKAELKKGCLSIAPFRRSAARLGIELLKYCACKILKVTPFHGGQDRYLASMATAVEAIQSSGAIPVLLAPFPHGDLVSDFWSRRFATGLHELANRKCALFVDTYGGLADIPRSQLLLSDRLHLSKRGHIRVAGLVVSVIEEFLRRGPTGENNPSPAREPAFAASMSA